ncbi:formate dehydrogenase accessory sulfurtransferase FdhD [Luteipulveratus sp. YIM 133132]|uniref:formate dehydrogenase accessory sulfurtransferase FdhD n=1 Tax=Luteipulveratus flavus TaxID=3031728 RepID=UPI0023AF3BE3|nr:formate dehydrogenase accessory sulfurtransferase FdhD [Luteipulveratus sp. YIM 133132]MDE9367360.1 formate dehydrogenase accessory sulfurtransferase FdhD [Luteipulveratus sp. YIM 133132]
MGRVTTRRPVLRIDLDGGERRRPDTLVVEEPLEIRVDGEVLTVTMRMPGHDVELVHGLLRSEGVIASKDDVTSARYCVGAVQDEQGMQVNTYNVIEVALVGQRGLPVSTQRGLVMHSGCGLCGKTSIDAIRQSLPGPLDPDRAGGLAPAVLVGLPDALREEQTVFSRTGGTHAAGLFTTGGEPVVVREDVGRHNAVDKVLGWAVLEEMDVRDLVLVVSSRASFEIVQKAAMSGVGVLATISAPSELAVAAADELGITLAGFVRRRSLNVYSHPHRLASSP